MIYFDNAATSYPKPYSVISAVEKSFSEYCANPGRGGYKSAMAATEMIYNTRSAVANFFNTDIENVIFTSGCTFSLNCSIKGLAKNGSHFIISDLEHNSVVRPLEKLKMKGIADYSIAKVENSDDETLKNFQNAIKKNTVAIICTLSSNVFGIMPPIKKIAKLAHENGLLVVLDAAQGAGYLPIDLKSEAKRS